MATPEELAAEKAAKEKAEQEAKAAAIKKNQKPDDPVKLKCVKLTGLAPNEKAPEVLRMAFNGVKYVIPVSGEMKGTMPRNAAEFLKAKAERYSGLKPELVILEPTFK